MIEKLKNFGPIYLINLKRRPDRLSICINNFKKYNINNFTIIEGIDSLSENLNNFYIGGGIIRDTEMGATLSHLKAIKHWIDNDNTEYAIIMEDDFSFETVDYWNFTWEEFLNSIDFDYDILQLCVIDGTLNPGFRKRKTDDYSTAAYLIKRKIAKKIISDSLIDNKYYLKGIKGKIKGDLVADVYLYKYGECYSVPLITYNYEMFSDINEDDKKVHIDSKDKIIEYWKNGGLTINNNI